MALSAQPRPAVLPVPGGRAGAAVHLHPLLGGHLAVPPGLLAREEGRFPQFRALGFGVPREEWVTAPVQAFLVEHPGAGLVLVDTGLHPSLAVDPTPNLGRILARAVRDADLEAPIPDRLTALGVDPGEVATVVMTHLHFDHASAISEFPGATFMLDELEWDAATSPTALLRGYARRHLDHPFDFRLLDFDGEGVDAFASFGRSLDLFGDGSVHLVATPGHTHGHLSVVLRLRSREVLLCGDAAYTLKTLDYGQEPGIVVDEHLFRRSLREIQRFRELTPGALVVPGHDLGAFESLKPRYD